MTVKEYLHNKEVSKITLQLIERLRTFTDDDDYVIGILAYSPYDEDRKLIIDYIDHGEDVSYENVILFSLEVRQRRKKMLAE